MSACIFIAADCQLPEVKPSRDYPLNIDFNSGIIDDGGADDNYFLITFDDVDIYCDKKYGVYIELHKYTDGRAKQIIDYIKNVLQQTDSVELWNVWLTDYWEYDDRPYINKKTISINELTTDDIKKINDAENWDKKYKNRPIFHCIEIVK